MTKRDLRYILVLLFCILWFFVLNASGCEFRDSPVVFVKGCNNYGIDWNTIIAPTGVIAIIALPASLLYFFLRIFTVFLETAAKLINSKDKTKRNDKYNIAINHRSFAAGLKTATRFFAGYGGR